MTTLAREEVEMSTDPSSVIKTPFPSKGKQRMRKDFFHQHRYPEEKRQRR